MSRIFTIVVILLLMAVVVLVPRIGMEEPDLDLGDGYTYRVDTLARFRLLLEGDGWSIADPPRNAQGMLEAVHGKTGLTFVLIPAGSFMMGSPEDEEGRYRSEGPVHKVRIPAFLLCIVECTQHAWESGWTVSDSDFKGAERPVETVNWTECRDWCGRNGLRLPSESEWEYACRAGSTARFCFGDEESRLAEYASYGDGVFSLIPPAGGKKPNSWGLLDMHGSVNEWCEDVWHKDYGGAPSNGTVWTTGDSPSRVVRGGCWFYPARDNRSASRNWSLPGNRFDDLGIRPAADLPEAR